MSASPPDEVLANPLDFYLADVGTDFPEITDDPTDFDVAWSLLGKEGDLNYDDGSVSQQHGETTYDWTPAGSTTLRKRFRTGEQFGFKVVLVDLSAESYALVMNNAAVTTGANSKSFSVFRGSVVNAFAVLARGVSSEDNDLAMHFKLPKAFVSVNGDVTWDKAKVAGLPVEIMAAVVIKPDDEPVCEIQTTDGS